MGERRERLVETALGQRGAKNGRRYVAWYNAATGAKLPLSAAWCAIFVSWCARQAGLSAKEVPNFAGCTTGRRLFKSLGIWRRRDDWTPRRGDLVLFDWDGDDTLAEHVGIVTGADSAWVYTVEGNSGGTVREKKYGRRSGCVLGYAAWREKEEGEDLTREETQALIDKSLEQWKSAREEKVYHRLEELPDWGRPTAEELIRQGRLQGDETGDLKLTQEMLRVLVILERKEGSHDHSAVGV